MIGLFYDTETTGLPLFSEPSEDPRQPHLVQLAACLVDLDTRATIASMDIIVRPDGWEIPEDVTAIHGITTERAKDAGISESLAVEMLLELWADRTRIGHNQTFDARIIRIALMRHNTKIGRDPEQWKSGKAECTQAMSTPILNVARQKSKTANLREAYLHFTGSELAGAHNAMVDVQACMAVYFAIKGAL